jgi:hypothetical protein
MIAGVIAAIHSLFNAVGEFFSFFREKRLKDAGRDAANLESARETLRRVEVSNEVDARPLDRDKSSILERM